MRPPPAIARLSGPSLAAMSGRGPEVGETREIELTGEDGGTFRVRVLSPSGTPSAVLVYYHGGGWVLSDIDLQYDTVARHLVDRAGCTVVMVNYRKAPEHRFPTAVDDAWTALTWVDEHRDDLAPPVAPLLVAGDSAGGNLAAVMAQRARDRGGPTIDEQILVYPVTDCDLDRPSYHDPENQLLLSRATMEWFWGHYAPDPQAREHPDASPLRHPDLTGLPPAFVYLAEHDPLHDEGREYADRLAAAGVDVTMEVAAGQMHTFFQMANLLPGYARGIDRVVQRIEERVTVHSPASA